MPVFPVSCEQAPSVKIPGTAVYLVSIHETQYTPVD
jgi:hypothetical protein